MKCFGGAASGLDDEIETHLAHETEDNIARGMSREAARNAALRAFGNITAARERARELDPLYWLDTLSQDIRFAARLIGRNRWTSLAIVSTLTVGIALNVSVFSLLNAILLRPWVRVAPETFISIIPRFSGQYQLRHNQYASMSQPDYAMYRDSAQSIESLAAYRSVSLTLSGSESGTVHGSLISCNLFDVVKSGPPRLGRYFEPEDCARPMQEPLAVLSESLWRSQFGGDTGVLGRVIHLNRIPFTVIGVAPDFSTPGLAVERGVWVPYTMLGGLRPSDEFFSDRRANWLIVVGRRKPGYLSEQVQEELNPRPARR